MQSLELQREVGRTRRDGYQEGGRLIWSVEGSEGWGGGERRKDRQQQECQ